MGTFPFSIDATSTGSIIRRVSYWCVPPRPVTIAGVCGETAQAVAEAELAASLDYDAALLSLAALRDRDNEDQVEEELEVARAAAIAVLQRAQTWR